MLKFNPNKYHNYAEITEFLKQAAEEFPDYVSLESIGLSYEKRKIWLVSLTNKKSGDHQDKPSIWVDGNTHASEIAGAEACLFFIYKTLTSLKKNSEIQFLLDKMNFYILPQVSPDGSEFFLNNKYEIRSSPKTHPNQSNAEKLVLQDIDQDGEILLMRKENPAGAFKKSSQLKELLVQRNPFDLPSKKETYYKLFKEGIFENYDGFRQIQETKYGLDFNRHFPAGFRPEGSQKGAGPYPSSSSEIRCFVEAFSSRPRIFAHLALHTYGGLVLRPPANSSEEKFDLQDLFILKMLADEAARVSGYESLSTAKDFKYYSRESETGTADEWSFDHRGVYSFTIEIWDVWKAAGIKVTDHVSRYFNPTEYELTKIFKWAKSKLPLSQFYKPWKKVEHPQLGNVEVGGWKTSFLFRNPPSKFLASETQKVNAIILQMAKVTPLINFKKTEIEKIDEKTKKLILIIENEGFLPTQGSQQAIRMKAINKPSVTVKTNGKLKLISGKKYSEIDHLQGRNNFVPFHSPVSGRSGQNTEEAKFEWILQGEGQVEVIFDYQRGGIIRKTIKI